MEGSKSKSAKMQGYAWAEGEERKRRRHMLPVSTLGMNTVASDSTTSSGAVCQDGRKITVGDSTLFKPLQWQDSPSFIDIIIRDHPNACFEQQEEVDQPLDKTRLEMHAAVECGGHSSSKPLNGPTPTSTPPIKNMLESEIAKITDKGGLVDFDGVEKFVQLMQPDRTWKKIDMADRIMLADVIASTNSFGCRGHFVQHRGLSVLDEWLQEDGRKISVGDCAFFKPPQESPNFIGIIRWLTSGKEDNLKLGVNWLYRPAEVKLGKGILLEAAPNEVFYSFHEDEIPAASLLHPCKVAFLRKVVELPSGISSFVCRRVYDIANKCLWWLTDQDYINERQEEVDQLLDKTRLEMHAAIQSGRRPPKPLNGPSPKSTPPIKTGTESVQNSATSFPSQGKGKKRRRGDQGSETIKRERSLKTDDGDSGHFRPENILKSEIAKITDRGLVDFEGSEKFVQLMHPDRTEKKIDMAGRIMLADVIASTDRFDCLGRFVQLRGLSVLDEWLQEVQKGKIGEDGSPKEGDKSIEEFLLALLHAFDKLPVSLRALQTCNVGKSVNHLRSHKNLVIQKKARSLVDTWKKRVKAEMKINEAKSGYGHAVSWPNKQGFDSSSFGSAASGSVQDSN